MKTLPPNMHAPECEATVNNFKQMIGWQVSETVTMAAHSGHSAIGMGAITMMGLLDAALEHFELWHQGQNLPLDEEAFMALVKQRMTLARANVASYRIPGLTSGALQ